VGGAGAAGGRKEIIAMCALGYDEIRVQPRPQAKRIWWRWVAVAAAGSTNFICG